MKKTLNFIIWLLFSIVAFVSLFFVSIISIIHMLYAVAFSKIEMPAIQEEYSKIIDEIINLYEKFEL